MLYLYKEEITKYHNHYLIFSFSSIGIGLFSFWVTHSKAYQKAFLHPMELSINSPLDSHLLTLARDVLPYLHIFLITFGILWFTVHIIMHFSDDPDNTDKIILMFNASLFISIACLLFFVRWDIFSKVTSVISLVFLAFFITTMYISDKLEEDRKRSRYAILKNNLQKHSKKR